MPQSLGFADAAFRMLLAMVASALLGLNRSRHGHVAGLRTTVLVGLAAAVSMLQVNLLLLTAGRTQSSFSVLDLMRLPLGVLTGMGFIGAGAIVRNRGAVSGVTTAAVLWLTTIVGLCFGGGQLALGSSVTLVALVAMGLLASFERRMRQDHVGQLTIHGADVSKPAVLDLLARGGYEVTSWEVRYEGGTGAARLRRAICRLAWRSVDAIDPPEFLAAVCALEGVMSVRWKVLPR
jgi:putative Mg2+ transporter-C (MgtC) family protein